MTEDEAARILVVAAHTDDETNCGGLLARAARHGATSMVVAFSHCEDSLPPGFAVDTLVHEFRSATDILSARRKRHFFPVRHLGDHRQEILERLHELRRAYHPTLVCCPPIADCHQDHRVVREEAFRCFFRRTGAIWAWDALQNETAEEVETFVELEPDDVNAKVRALACYQSQAHRTYYDEAYVRALARVRGGQCRSETGLAEAYKVLYARI